MCDKAVVDSLATLKFISDWFVTSKMIEKLFTSLYGDKNIFYFEEDSGNIDLNNINLDNNFDEDYPDTITLIRPLAWDIEFEKGKALNKI